MKASENEKQKELEVLLERLVDHKLTHEEVARMQQLLLGNEQLQEFYWSFIRMHYALRREGEIQARGHVLPQVLLSLNEHWTSQTSILGDVPMHDAECNSPTVSFPAGGKGITPHAPISSLQPKSKKATQGHTVANVLSLRWLTSGTVSSRIVAAASLLLLVGILWSAKSSMIPAADVQVVDATQLIRNGREISLQAGAPLALGETFFLESGQLRLQTKSGTSISVEGPAEIQPQQHDRLYMEFGRAHVRVSKEQSGFVLEGPTVKVTDLGTEFGLDIALNGRILTEVYEGRILVEALEKEDIAPFELLAGWAVSLSDGIRSPVNTYPLGKGNPMIAWDNPARRCCSAVLASRPEYYHRFDTLENGIAKSLGNRSVYDAQVSGDTSMVESGPLTSLGTPGHCLQFAGDGATEIPIGLAAVEQTGEYSFSLWVRFDKLANQNIFVATNHLGPGQRFGPQLRLLSDGTLEHYLYNKGPRGGSPERLLQRSKTVLEPGRWYHVTLTASTGGTMQLFLNGVPAATPVYTKGPIEGEYHRLMFAVRSGYLKGVEHHMESLTGAVDEFAFYNRALTKDEVTLLFEAAQPWFQGESSR